MHHSYQLMFYLPATFVFFSVSLSLPLSPLTACFSFFFFCFSFFFVQPLKTPTTTNSLLLYSIEYSLYQVIESKIKRKRFFVQIGFLLLLRSTSHEINLFRIFHQNTHSHASTTRTPVQRRRKKRRNKKQRQKYKQTIQKCC